MRKSSTYKDPSIFSRRTLARLLIFFFVILLFLIHENKTETSYIALKKSCTQIIKNNIFYIQDYLNLSSINLKNLSYPGQFQMATIFYLYTLVVQGIQTVCLIFQSLYNILYILKPHQ